MPEVAVADRRRLHVRVSGLVQGVGFRPFVYRAAAELGLTGFVENNDRGVDIEVEGESSDIGIFLDRIKIGTPPLASVAAVEACEVAVVGTSGFQIRDSGRHGVATTRISPDAAICDDCLRELFDPRDRRFRYPFINCTNCGPRYTIVEGIPYDRPLTSMKRFAMCPECSREYHDPMDRRFHAQPNACPVCGPQIFLRDRCGKPMVTDDPIATVQSILVSGGIVAVKGLGGFHLAVNPHDDAAIRRLRARKGRAEKPFALMARDLEVVFRYCNVTLDEERALQHRTRPIVLLDHVDEEGAPNLALGALLRPRQGPTERSEEWSLTPFGMTDCRLTELAFMLPYTPIHHLLLDGRLDVLVMTSANLSEEPIAIGNQEAYERLGGIADYFLVHDRDILQRCDDSVVRIVDGEMAPIRRARGFVPDPVVMPVEAPASILACGGELKNTIGLARGNDVFLSQHIGDLDNPSAYQFFEDTIVHLKSILEIEPKVVAFDMHPEYLSTKWATAQENVRPIAVQHHHAHLAAVMAENGVTKPTIGIILDGTGYGTDGTIWGGEVLVGNLADFERFAWLRPFALPGGTAAIKHPWRTAYALVLEALASQACPNDVHLAGPTAVPTWLSNHLLPFKTTAEREAFDKVMRRRINTPMTSSCGRLFDGVSALLGLCREVTYEAQAAIALEMAAEGCVPGSRHPGLDPGSSDVAGGVVPGGRHPGLDPGSSDVARGGTSVIEPARGSLDWTPILRSILDDLHNDVPISVIARTFHASLADLFIGAAVHARSETGINRVGLSGGVFQNQLLFNDVRVKLTKLGFEVLSHRLVPTNDGGLAYGQAVVAASVLRHERQ